MGCDLIELADGVTVLACSRGARGKKRCQSQGCYTWADSQCDWKLAGDLYGKTCDRYMCREHSVRQEGMNGRDNIDYCHAHQRFLDFLTWFLGFARLVRPFVT